MAKASDNAYPSVLVVPGVAPASPAAGQQRLYLDSADSNKLKRKDSAGTVVTVEGAAGGGGISVTSATVATSEATTSVTYVDLATAGPAVTVTVPASGRVMVFLTAFLQNSALNGYSNMGFAISGASTVAASDAQAVRYQAYAAGGAGSYSAVYVVTGLTAGSTTFTAKYSAGSTATFANRTISVLLL